MTASKTMFDKIWEEHVITEDEDGQSLLYVALNFAHDGSFHAFGFLESRGLQVRRPSQIVATPDHGIPTRTHNLDDIADLEQRRVILALRDNARRHGFTLFDLDDARQGIVHVVGPEQGLTQPGLLIVCGDSHTSTHGALGALSFGIGATEASHVLATQTIWQRKPRTMRIRVDGIRSRVVTAKDVILSIIARIGANGAQGHVIEYAGSTIDAMSIEERLTVCNMSIEAGARAGMIAPDQTTFAYLKNRPYAPKGKAWDQALRYWKTLPSDSDARFDAEVAIDATRLAPMVTWGNSPENVVPVTGHIPDPEEFADARQRSAMRQMLDYMGLTPGERMLGLPIDQVFIGSCTNARIEDLREAAAVVQRGTAVVSAMVSPGSTQVKQQAEAEGIDRIFREAGFEWREAGCSMCVAMNGDIVGPGKRCASTSNRNFPGRQGPGSRTHLMSPAMAAAAALRGHICDVRDLMGEV